MAGPRQQVGDILLRAGLITRDQLASALDIGRSSGLRLGEVMVGLGYVTEADVAKAVAQQVQAEFIPDHLLQFDMRLARLLPAHLIRHRSVLPVREQGGRLVLAMADPLDVVTVDEVHFITGMPVQVAVATRSALDRAIHQFQRVAALGRQKAGGPAPDQVELPPELDAAPIIKLVNELIDRALDDGASDIHVEPGEQQFRIRMRLDGFLRETLASSMQSHPSLTARLKVMAGLDISERRLPQDGRIELRERGRNVDLRVSTLPTIYGEKVVLRLFDKSRQIPALEDLGMRPADYRRYLSVVGQPHGMLLVTGPTGSGKTTTLLATLAHLSSPDKNVVTIEDPVEYQLVGVNHVQVRPKAGLTFAEGLRSILRQDPDIIMVGEVRDSETADVAVRAALTGHLVLSTLHTNDAPGALNRLIDMGVEPYLIASSVHGVLAQRLVRRLCPHCRIPAELDPAVVTGLGHPTDSPVPAYRPQGCNRCRGTGYLGRFPLFEFLPVSPEIRDLVTRRVNAARIQEQAHREGMCPLLSNGIERVLEGHTTLEEVLRVAHSGE